MSGPDLLEDLLPLARGEPLEQVLRHLFEGPVGNDARPLIQRALALLRFHPLLHVLLELVAQDELRRGFALSCRPLLHSSSPSSISMGTPAMRFAIQSSTSAVTQKEERPTFLGCGNAPLA